MKPEGHEGGTWRENGGEITFFAVRSKGGNLHDGSLQMSKPAELSHRLGLPL